MSLIFLYFFAIPSFVTCLTGLERQPFYEQPVNITLSGKAQKATTTSATAYASGAIADIYQSVIVNSYGKGKGVLVAFDLGKSSDGANDMTTYSALFGRIIGNTAPIETRPIPGGVAPVEITVESIGSAFDLKVVEKADTLMAILDAALNGSIDSINSTVTWSTHIDSNQTVRYLSAVCHSSEGPMQQKQRSITRTKENTDFTISIRWI